MRHDGLHPSFALAVPAVNLEVAAVLQQLAAIDCAYLAVIAAINYAFPYVLVPVAFNPAQLIVLPSETASGKKA